MNDEERKTLLARLARVEKIVRADLLAQFRADPALMERALQCLAEEEASPADSRAWLEAFAGRAAVLYLLKSLYVRVLEDQALLHPVRIREGGTFELFRHLFPQLGQAAYLRTVFTEASRALPELFAPTRVEIAEPGEASAREVWAVWQEAARGGGPLFDFRDELDTRFIGDLYQDLDPDVKERYALLQTPRFIEEFILDHTLEPALAEVGLHELRLIDPTCGSGHFLVGSFERLALRWRVELGDRPDSRWESASRALAAVHGADLNEYACALSRFRLLLAVVKETGERDLDRLRTLAFNVITCDALIPWERIAGEMLPGMADISWLADYGTPAERGRNEMFFARGFHAVVGNPPYISVKDKKKREDYRRAWPRSAAGKYSLSAPMTERFLTMPLPDGHAGLIVANNFCKREFGKGLVEKALRDVQLDLVVDSSGAYIPGHGTPTVMLFATRTAPDLTTAETVVVASKRGEPREPPDPAQGTVWSSIAAHVADAGYEDAWIAVGRKLQATLVRHPWSLGSDAVTDLKAALDTFPRLRDLGADAGPAVIIIEDEAFIRRYARAVPLRPIVFGENVRDWAVTGENELGTAVYPYEMGELVGLAVAAEDLWSLRATLGGRRTFVGTFLSNGRPWYEYERNRTDRLGDGRFRIAVGEVAANNQFVADSSNAIFTQTAPVIAIRDADEAAYRDVAAILNSSTLEFWFKQVCFPKGDADGRQANAPFERRYVRNGTNVLQAPIEVRSRSKRAAVARAIRQALDECTECRPALLLESTPGTMLSAALSATEPRLVMARERLVALQEELDWMVYEHFGLVADPPLCPLDEIAPLARGHRPFEIVLARRVSRGEEESAWFERHGLEPATEIPARYTGPMRATLERRIRLIESDPTIALLEQPVHKRRWSFEPWAKMLVAAADSWLLAALEEQLRAAARSASAADLSDALRANPTTAAVQRCAINAADQDFADTIGRLLARESIPDNPAALFAPSGLAKLVGSHTVLSGPLDAAPEALPFAPGEPVDWKRVWRLQEREDAGKRVAIEVPPPFVPKDYAHPNGWRIRGKFNVPNERFIVYDQLEPKRYAWGGWGTAERARLSMDAYDRRDRQADGAAAQPTADDPRRCDVQFALWDKVDELRRTRADEYDDVATLARLCGRTCPCDVLPLWREQRAPAGRRRSASAAPAPAVVPAAEVTISTELLEAVFATVRGAGGAGAALPALEIAAGGNRALARRVLDALRADGRIEAFGRGRGARYRLAAERLL